MRSINKIIIHCSATPEGRAVSVQEIDKWHRDRGFRCIGYHYVIGLEGQIEIGRPVEQSGAHCSGYNTDSIGICYIGGLDSAGKPKDTRTPAQRLALKQLVQLLKRAYPEASVHGHREFANKSCPCFDVQREFGNL